MYRDKDGASAPVQDLNVICTQIPVHVILGGIPDYLYGFSVISPNLHPSYPPVFRPRSVQDGLTDPKSGRRFASVTRIPNTGHLVNDMPIDSVTR